MTDPARNTTAHIGALTEAVASLDGGLALLRGDVQREARTRHRENVINVAVAALLGLMVLLVLVVSYQNNVLAHQNQALSAQIRSCTQPGGTCYEQGRQRTGAAVSGLMDAQILIAVCSRATATEADLRQCVQDRLRTEPAPSPTPTPQPTRTR